MLRYVSIFVLFVLSVWLVGCTPNKESIFQGGDDSPITITDGSMTIFSKMPAVPSTGSPTTIFTFTIPANHEFHHLLDENALQIFDLRNRAWTIKVTFKSSAFYVTLEKTSNTDVTVTAHGSSFDTPGNPYGYSAFLSHHEHAQIDQIFLNGTQVSCTPGANHCHLSIYACHKNGCT